MSVAYHEGSAERNPQPQAVPLATLNHALQCGEHAIAIYIHMTNLAQGTSQCSPSIEELCDLTDLSRNTVRKYLGKLESAGLVRVLIKGAHRGQPTIYQLTATATTVDNIIPFPEERGQMGHFVSQKGSTDHPFSEERGQMDDEKGSTDDPFWGEKGVNDTGKRGQRQCTDSPIPPSSVNTEKLRTLNTTTSGGGVIYPTDSLAYEPRVVAFANKHNLTEALVTRSLDLLQIEWQKTGQPKNRRQAVDRAMAWLNTGVTRQIFATWRQQDPFRMAGIVPK